MNKRILLSFLFVLGIFNFSIMEAVITWQLPALPLSLAGEDAGSPQIALDGQGNAVAIWTRYNGTNYVIQGATYDSSSSSAAWSMPVDISITGQDADLPQLSINSSGFAVAVWSSFDGNNFVVQSATTYTQVTPQNRWSVPILLSNEGNDAQNPQVGVDAKGNGVVLWVKNSSDDPTSTFIEAAILTQGILHTRLPISSKANFSVMPKVAINPAGQAVAVWRSCVPNVLDETSGIIYSAIYSPTRGWNTPVSLSASGKSASIPKVGIDQNGNAIAVWRRSNGSNFVIHASTLLNGTWSSPIHLSTEGLNSDQPKIAVDLTGQAVVCWSTQIDPLTSVIQASQSNTQTPNTWSVPTDFTVANNAYCPDVAIQQENTGLIWSLADCTTLSTIQASSALTSNFLPDVTQNLFGPADPADESRIGVSLDNIHVAAVWRGFDGLNNRIYAAIGTLNSPLLPTFSISPMEGPIAGGTTVILTGSGLMGATRVAFGSIPASFIVDSDTQITAISPPGIGGLEMVTVTVTTPVGQSLAQPDDQFTYLPLPPVPPDICIAPNQGPEGTVVTITGHYLNDTSAVLFGSVPAQSFTLRSHTEIIAVAPRGLGTREAETVTVSVITPAGHSIAQPCNQFTYLPLHPVSPDICIAPNQGPEAGGIVVTITGHHLNGTSQVLFGSIPALNFKILSSTEITATAPPGTGTVTVSVTTPAGNSVASACNQFVYMALPVPLPPTSLQVRQIRHQFATQTDLINIVKWSASPTPGISAYYIYRNAKLIGKISSDKKLLFRDHNQRKHTRTTYSITAVIGKEESEPFTIVLKK